MISHSMSEWLQGVKQIAPQRSPMLQDVIEQDLSKWGRLQKLHEQIGLPIEQKSDFSVQDFLEGSVPLREFFRKSPASRYSIKAEPKKEFEQTLFRIRKHGISKEGCYALVSSLPGPERFRVVTVWPQFETEVGGIMLVGEEGILIELTRGPHHTLTQGTNDSEIVRCSLDFSTRKLDAGSAFRQVAEQAIQQVRTSPPCEFPSAQGFVKGYFEFLYAPQQGFAFIDFNTTQVMNSVPWPLPSPKEVESIRGIPASPGIVQGKVRVITGTADLHKVERGDIIVTAMTDPSYLQAIARAQGIITDHGGMLCHPAIVARELQKPCIVGTKVATQALKDGEFVELNATKGTVHVLHRNEP